GAMSPSATQMCQKCWLLDRRNPEAAARVGAVARLGPGRKRHPVRICAGCKLRKPDAEFAAARNYCKKCLALRSRQWKLDHLEEWSERAIHYQRAHRLGITVAEYRERGYADRDWHRCEVCRTEPARQRHHMDHCHTCQAFRGVLCHDDNQILGLAKDNPARLRALADYLERHAARRTDGVSALRRAGHRREPRRPAADP
ncbi:MAG: endonuclease domain-containing protein, partial [Acidimicrobiales bacterium]